MNIYRGNIVYSKSPNELVELKRGYVVVKDGIIFGVYAILPHVKFSYKQPLEFFLFFLHI